MNAKVNVVLDFDKGEVINSELIAETAVALIIMMDEAKEFQLGGAVVGVHASELELGFEVIDLKEGS